MSVQRVRDDQIKITNLPEGRLTNVSGAVSAIKENLAAVAAPTGSDNFAAGYAIGSRWIYGDIIYDCTGDSEWYQVYPALPEKLYTGGIDLPYANLATVQSALGIVPISGLTTNYLPKWNGTTFVDSAFSDNGTLALANKPLYFGADTSTSGQINDGGVAGALYLATRGTYPIYFGDLSPLAYAYLNNSGLMVGAHVNPSAKIQARSTTEQLRLEYSSGVDVRHTVDASGNNTINTSGGYTTLAGAGVTLKIGYGDIDSNSNNTTFYRAGSPRFGYGASQVTCYQNLGFSGGHWIDFGSGAAAPSSTDYGIGLDPSGNIVLQVGSGALGTKLYSGSTLVLATTSTIITAAREIHIDGAYPSSINNTIWRNSSTRMGLGVTDGFDFYVNTPAGAKASLTTTGFGVGLDPGVYASVPLHAQSTSGEQLRLQYSSGVDVRHTVSAAGDYAIRPTGECLALGNAAYSTGSRSIAIGASATVASGCTEALAMGYGATVATGGTNSLAIGDLATCSANQGLSFGYSAAASGGAGALAIGPNATASAAGATAIGRGATASGAETVAVGYSSLASGVTAVAIGYDSTASADYSIAMGYLATASATNTIALGTAATAAITNTMVVGSDLRPINTIWAGKGEPNATPTLWSIRGTSGLGTNINGGDIAVDAGAGTGTNVGATGRLRATSAVASGTTLQSTWVDAFTWGTAGVLTMLANGFTISGTELGYLDGATSNLQAQIDALGAGMGLPYVETLYGSTTSGSDASLDTSAALAAGTYLCRFSMADSSSMGKIGYKINAGSTVWATTPSGTVNRIGANISMEITVAASDTLNLRGMNNGAVETVGSMEIWGPI